jgi:hypothetical protein
MIALPASRRADHHHSLALHAEMEIIFFEASRTVVPHGQRRGATYLLVIDPGPCLPFVSPSIACLIACPPRRTGGSLSGRPHFVTAPTSNGPSPPRPHAPATVRYVCRGFELDVRVARRRGGSNVAHRKGWRAVWSIIPWWRRRALAGCRCRVGGRASDRHGVERLVVSSILPIPPKYTAWRGLTIIRGTSMTVSSCSIVTSHRRAAPGTLNPSWPSPTVAATPQPQTKVH